MVESAKNSTLNVLDAWEPALKNATDAGTLDEVENAIKGIGAVPCRTTDRAMQEATESALPND